MTYATIHKDRAVKSRDHKAFIRELPCIQCAIEGRETYGVDPAHVSHAFPGWPTRGLGSKVSDLRCTPSCRPHHDEQHADNNERRYWARYGLNPVLFCQALVDCDGDVERGAQTVRDYAAHARRGLPTVHVATGPVTKRPAGPTPVTITAYLATRPRDEHGNIGVLIPREAGLRDAACDLVWVAPTALQSADKARASRGEG